MKGEHIRDRIKRMSKDEKVAEFKHYVTHGMLLRVDLDQVLADQAAVDAPDSSLDEALWTIANLVGGILGREPLTAHEMTEIIDGEAAAIQQWARRQSGPGLRTHEPAFSLRRRR